MKVINTHGGKASYIVHAPNKMHAATTINPLSHAWAMQQRLARSLDCD